jgi:hypothetical protein
MKFFGELRRMQYICIVFFMVLDLRLTMKIGCRETTIPFLYIQVYDIHFPSIFSNVHLYFSHKAS